MAYLAFPISNTFRLRNNIYFFEAMFTYNSKVGGSQVVDIRVFLRFRHAINKKKVLILRKHIEKKLFSRKANQKSFFEKRFITSSYQSFSSQLP